MLRQLDDKTLVSGQIAPDDIAELKRLGVTTIVNNRPDGEDPGQPLAAEIQAAAEAAGLAYCAVPIVRGMGPTDIQCMREAMEGAEGRVLAFCRSGTRSTYAWALAKREQGEPVEAIERAAADAGFDLGPIRHLF